MEGSAPAPVRHNPRRVSEASESSVSKLIRLAKHPRTVGSTIAVALLLGAVALYKLVS